MLQVTLELYLKPEDDTDIERKPTKTYQFEAKDTSHLKRFSKSIAKRFAKNIEKDYRTQRLSWRKWSCIPAWKEGDKLRMAWATYTLPFPRLGDIYQLQGWILSLYAYVEKPIGE